MCPVGRRGITSDTRWFQLVTGVTSRCSGRATAVMASHITSCHCFLYTEFLVKLVKQHISSKPPSATMCKHVLMLSCDADIVLLCVDCHHVAHKAAEMVKKQLSTEYSVPLFPPKAQPIGGNVCETHPYNVRRAAVALKVYGKTLPDARRKELQQMVRGFVHPGSGEASGEEWLSQEEMDQGLLAGLAPRQKRRMMRQLAAEKQRATTGTNSSLDVTKQVQQESALSNNSETDSHSQAALAEHSAPPIAHDDKSRQDSPGASAPYEQPAASLQQPTVSPEHAEVANRHQQGDQCDQDDSDELVGDGQEGPGSRQGVSDEDTNGHAWHGRQVVAAVLEQGGPDALLMLVQRFRQSFTDALHPEHLPAAWHIKHRYARLEFQERLLSCW